jgi:hypothetical protein
LALESQSGIIKNGAIGAVFLWLCGADIFTKMAVNPQNRKRHPMRHTLTSLALATTLLTACGSQVINPVSGQAERSVMSEADEIAEGRSRMRRCCKSTPR